MEGKKTLNDGVYIACIAQIYKASGHQMLKKNSWQRFDLDEDKVQFEEMQPVVARYLPLMQPLLLVMRLEPHQLCPQASKLRHQNYGR